MRRHDWSATALGLPAEWPSSLKTAVRICLTSRFPIVLWWGPELRLLYNDAWRPVLGATKHPQALGSPGHEVWPEIWHIIGPMFAQVLATGRATWEDDQLLVLDRYGYLEEAYFTYSYSPIRLDSGEVGGVFAAVNETTERVLGERRRETLRRLAAQASEAKSVSQACSRAATVLADNDADVPFALLYTLDAEGGHAELTEAVRLSAGTAVAPRAVSVRDTSPESAPWPIAAVVRTGQAVVVENLAERIGALPGGRWPQPATSAVAVPLTGAAEAQPLGVLVLGVSPARALDADYRAFAEFAASHLATAMANARAYAQAQERADALAELDRAKTTFFSNVSHEFRTPLTLMLGPLEDLLDAPDVPAAARDQATVARRNALRLLKLVNSLLDFSRLEAGRVEAQYEPVDLAALTADLASTFRSAVERADLRLVVDCPALPEPTYVDRDMWEKIVLNLLSNAFKFTFQGEIAVALRQEEAGVALTVSDTGIGIPPDELSHVFERFRRVQNARARTYEGSGIGLALVHELVKLHGGKVALMSEVGRGTTFEVTLRAGSAHLPAGQVVPPRPAMRGGVGAAPFVEEALRWLPAATPTESGTGGYELLPEAPVGRRPGALEAVPARILVADDNEDMREYIGRLLGARWSVETVADGHAALARAMTDPPDLLLSDVMMPGLDGFGLLRALRADARTRELPFILLSARAGEDSRVEGLQRGADDYLVKPFSARELVARVESSLTLARLRREVAEVERGLRAEAEAREERLRQSEARLQSALDLARLVPYEWEPVTGVLRCDADLRAMWGLPADAAVDYEVWRNGIHSDDRTFVEARLARATDPGGDGLYEAEYRVGGERQGFLRWVATRGQVFFENGRAVALVGVAQDITERKEAEEALRRREQQFVSLAENLPDLIARYDRELRHVYVNRAITELTGKSAEYFLDRRVTESEGPPELMARWGEAVAGVFFGGATAELEFEFPGPGGIHHYNARLVPERDGDGTVASVISIARDVTTHRQNEERLRQAAKMEAIGRLAGGIAHDFNNQLHGVSGFATFVSRDPGLGARTRQDLEEIQKATERMAGLTRQLLAFSRQQLLTLETLDLNAAVADGRSLLHRLIGTNVEMVLELLPDPLWVRADRSQLLQVLMNLAINARDAMPNGGRLTLHTGMREVTAGDPVAAAAGTIEPGSYAVLTVTDAGVGIPAADLPHIFEPFFTTKEVGQGTGLGLATVHGIVSQSQGHIWVESAPAKGTTFTVLLPSAAGPTAALEAPKVRQPGSSRRARILVVDDEDLVRTIVSRTLESEQYEVLEARNGREALECLAQSGGRIDLVLSDVVMPGLDAHELSERLAAEYPTVRLVWMSGYPRDSFARLAKSQPFMQKPVPADILLDIIGGLIAKGAPPASG